MPKKKIILFAVVLAGLGAAGFFLVPRAPVSPHAFKGHQQEALDAMNKSIELCQSKYMYGELKTYQQEAECATPGIVDAFRNAGFPYMDLVQKLTDERVELAKKLDRKEITRAAAQQQDADFLVQMHEEAVARLKAKKK